MYRSSDHHRKNALKLVVKESRQTYCSSNRKCKLNNIAYLNINVTHYYKDNTSNYSKSVYTHIEITDIQINFISLQSVLTKTKLYTTIHGSVFFINFLTLYKQTNT